MTTTTLPAAVTASLREGAGYVHVIKRTIDTRQRTWLALTHRGRNAFTGHIAELQRLAGAARV